jgi:putative toxin-antitoxin system antitoxin component (TIGR02293 family)
MTKPAKQIPSGIKSFLAKSAMDQARDVKDGLAANIVMALARELLDLPVFRLVEMLRLSQSSIGRKIRTGARLLPWESDRIARLMFIYELSVEAFEDQNSAREWILRNHVEFGNEKPIEILDTEAGYSRVRDVLTRLMTGICV